MTFPSKVFQLCKLHTIALFPGPTQLSVACSMEKQEKAWYLFSLGDVRIEKLVESLHQEPRHLLVEGLRSLVNMYYIV